jgi:hypothetical protein
MKCMDSVRQLWAVQTEKQREAVQTTNKISCTDRKHYRIGCTNSKEDVLYSTYMYTKQDRLYYQKIGYAVLPKTEWAVHSCAAKGMGCTVSKHRVRLYRQKQYEQDSLCEQKTGWAVHTCTANGLVRRE